MTSTAIPAIPTDALWVRGANELAQLIASGTVTSSEVVEAHLDRIDAVNPHLNAVVRVLRDEARAAAREADQAVADGAPLGPLHGVPCTIKENVDVAGTPTTDGIPALADAVASRDAPLVERLRAAGAIPIGRTNMPDFALRFHTDSSLHGLTRNPWDPTVTSGGSSGGEAAAVASGMSPLGIGNDIGGSLRNPAVRRAGKILQAAGYEVEEVVPPMYEEALDIWGRWLMTDIRALRPLLQQLTGPDGMRFLDFIDPLYAELSTAMFVQTFVERRTIARLWTEFLAEHPLVVSPVWTQPAFKHGFDIESVETAAATMRLVRPVMPANLLGLPAAVVAGGTTSGLPVGVQVLGDRFQELLCLEAAEVIEREVGALTPIEPVR